jgi:predicted  nucleic acid-binding Zn-ribbon protein
MEYKSKVQRLIQRMEQQQAQLLREQDAKSLEFRRRMDRLVYGPMNRPQVETDGDDNNATMDRDDEQTAKRGNHKQGSQVTKTHVSNHQQQDGTNKTTSQCTEATRSISTSSWSVASNSREEEDDEEYKVGSHFRNNCFPATPIQPEVVHIPLNAIASTPPEPHRNNHDAATIASLQKRIESLELDKCALESENAALRSLRESYKKRFSVEQQQRNQLQDQVALLKSYLEDTQQRNQELRQEMQASKLAQRQKRNQYLAKEQEWKHKIERIKRDFDHLWTKQKTSQKDLKESNAVVDDLQAELATLRKQERKWGKEKSFLQGKVQYLQSSTKMFTATAPKGVEKDAAPSST